MSAYQIGILFTTLDSESRAKELARLLVEKQLAACVQLSSIRSIYRWNDQIEETPEILLICKYPLEKHNDLLDMLSSHHPYDIPEIVTLQGNASFAYFSWTHQTCGIETK